MTQERNGMPTGRNAAAVCIALGLLAALAGCTAPYTTDTALVELGFDPDAVAAMKSERARLARLPNRVMFDNDGCDAAYFPADREPTAENLLPIRTTPLLETHVDTLAYCTISSGFGLFTHRTQAGEQLTWDLVPLENRRNITGDLLKQGTDPLDIMLRFCHEYGLECFWSMRMNDTHDQAHQPDKPYSLFPTLKKDHPEYLVGSFENRPKHGSWTAVDYALPEVRNLAFSYIEEVCENYPVDGVELDFFRHMSYLKSVAWGGTATPAERAAVTDLIRRVRLMTERIAMRRGRPILIAARVPDSAEYARAVGLDIEQWLRDGLVDILIGSGYFKLNPWTCWAGLGRTFDTPVYAGLSESRVSGEDKRFRRQSTESYRARALRAWKAGVDGLYIFNIYNPKAQFLKEIGEPHELETLDKIYFATVRDGAPGRYLSGGDDYRNVPVLTPHRPWELYARQPRELTLTVGDDPRAAERNGAAPVATCHLRVDRIDRPENLRAEINGHELRNGVKDGEWIDYAVQNDWLRCGRNTLRFAISDVPAAASGEKPDWDMEYRCDHKLAYPTQLPWRRAFPACDYIEEIQDGTLLLADRDTGRLAFPHLVYPWRVAAEDETVVEARLRVLRSDTPTAVCIRVANGSSVEILTLERNRLGLHFAGLSAPFNTSDDFHTYRIRMKEDDIQVFADGTLVLDGTGAFKTPAGDRSHWLDLLYGLSDWCRRSLYIGSASGTGTGEAAWEFIRFRSDTRFGLIKDVVLALDYPTDETTEIQKAAE